MEYALFIVVVTVVSSVPFWVYIVSSRVPALIERRTALTLTSGIAAVVLTAVIAQAGGLDVASEVSYAAMVVLAMVLGAAYARSR